MVILYFGLNVEYNNILYEKYFQIKLKKKCHHK